MSRLKICDSKPQTELRKKLNYHITLWFYLLIGLASGMISTNVLNIFVRWIDALWLFQLYTLVNGLEIEDLIKYERVEKESIKNATFLTHPFFVLFRTLKSLPRLLITRPPIASKVVLRDKPIGRITDHIDISGLSQPMARKVEIKMMLQ